MEYIVFTITAIVAIIGAAAMLISRNAVHSALFMLLNFSSIAVLYLLLRAPFLFAVQLIVYAGAIIVLFLFVVMLLGAERAEDEADQLAWQRPVALVMGLVLLAEAVYVFFLRSGAAMGTARRGRRDVWRAAQDRRGAVYDLPAAVRNYVGDPAGGADRRGGAAPAAT